MQGLLTNKISDTKHEILKWMGTGLLALAALMVAIMGIILALLKN